MNTRGNAVRIVIMCVLVCAALWVSMRACTARDLRSLGEVTAVVEGPRPGTVVVRTVRDGTAGAWVVDDTSEAVGFFEPADGVVAEPQATQCAGELCYRVPGDGLRVEHSTDGGVTFTTAWEVGGSRYTRITSTYPDLGDPAQHLSSLSLVVHSVPGGHIVFVANGRDGLLYRDVRGAWHRQGVPDSGEGCCFYVAPPRIGEASEAPDPAVPVGAGAAAVILLVGLVGALAGRRWRGLPVVVVVAVSGGVAAGIMAPLGDVGMFPGYFYSGPIILGIVVGGSIVANRFAAAPATREAGAPR
jgi:hypothetical protein